MGEIGSYADPPEQEGGKTLSQEFLPGFQISEIIKQAHDTCGADLRR